MFKEERRTSILNLLIKDHSVSVSKLAVLFNVSQRLYVQIFVIFRKQECFCVVTVVVLLTAVH